MKVLGRLVAMLIPLLATLSCVVDFDAVEDRVREARRGLSTYQWRDGSDLLEVRIKNDVSVNDAESDVTALEPEGFLEIQHQSESGSRGFKATYAGEDRIERQFTRDGEPVPASPEAREWLAHVLPRIMRQTGLSAGTRVERLLAEGGSEAVADEIEKIKSSTVQRIYVDELMARTEPTPSEARRIAQAAAQQGSSSDLERVVEQLVDVHPEDEALTLALIEAVGGIRSSSGLVRLAEFICSQRKIGEEAALKLAESLSEVRSSSERANGLVTLSETAPDTEPVRIALLDSAEGIRSSSEKARAVFAILEKSRMEKGFAIRAAEVAQSIRSSSERARALRLLVTDMPTDPDVLQAVLDATRAIATSAQDQVLSSLIRRDFEKSELEMLLQFVAEDVPEGGTAARLRERIERKLSELE